MDAAVRAPILSSVRVFGSFSQASDYDSGITDAQSILL